MYLLYNSAINHKTLVHPSDSKTSQHSPLIHAFQAYQCKKSRSMNSGQNVDSNLVPVFEESGKPVLLSFNSILYFHNNTSKIHKSKYNKTFSTAKRQESYG